MKPCLRFLNLAAFFMTLVISAPAQKLDDAGDYFSAFNNAQVEMNKTYMTYMSEVAHSKNPKKIDNMRAKVLESITNCKYKVTDLPIYKGDNSLRKSAIDYVDLCYKVFNEDYAHIVNMEEISEQSFDEMQAYLLLKQKTNEKIEAASDSMNTAGKNFAAKYKINLIESKDELSRKMEMAGRISEYKDKVYLLFFKCNWQDSQITEAINKQNVGNIEQAGNALANYAKEGLAILDTLKNFDGDGSLKSSCKQALSFYQKLGTTDLPKLADYYLKEENFDKIKKSFDAKAEKDRTKEDVDAFNKGVREMNAASNAYNQNNNNINSNRNQIVQNWNHAEEVFLDYHMPHYN